MTDKIINPDGGSRTQFNPTSRGMFWGGLVLLCVGCFCFRDFWHDKSHRLLPPLFMPLLMISPALAVVGFVMLLTGTVRMLRRGLPIYPTAVSPAEQRFRRLSKIAGWTMLGIGACPWLWLGALTSLSGGRPGNEGEGMAGMMIFLFVGVPGFGLTIFNRMRKRN